MGVRSDTPWTAFGVFLVWVLGMTCPAYSSGSEKAVSASQPAAALSVAEVVIEILDAPGDAAYWKQMAEDLVFVRVGEPLSEPLLEQTLQAMELCRRFGEIHVDSREGKDGMTLAFRLTPFRQIRAISISGGFPVLEKEIRSSMTVAVGDPVVPEDLQQQERLIAELFRRQGYVAPKVRVGAKEEGVDGSVHMGVVIEKGPFYRLDRLEMSGNHAFSESDLKRKMKVKRGVTRLIFSGRFVEADLRRDVRTLVAYYRKKGYADCSIDARVDKDPHAGKVSAVLTVQEGPRYEVTFQGNARFSNRRLRKDLVFFEQGNTGDLGLRRSLTKIREGYTAAGYPKVEVKMETSTRAEDKGEVREIRILIEEGPCTTVRSVHVGGNQVFSDEKIRRQMLTRPAGLFEKGAFVAKTLEEDVGMIRTLYRREGYLSAEVDKTVRYSQDGTEVDVTLRIEEGVQTLVASLRFEGLTLLQEDRARGALLLKEGQPFREYLVQSDENTLSSRVSEKGHPHVQVKGSSTFTEKGRQAQVVYRVQEGPLVRMGRVYYAGNFRTKKHILDRELEMGPGDPFSLTGMLEGQSNIRDTDLFDSVRFRAIGLKEKREEIPLFVEVQEKRPYFVQAGAGYETEKGFFLTGKTGDHNLRGTNKDAWVGGEASEIGYRADFGLKEPRALGTRVAANLAAFAEKREEFNLDFGIRTMGASLGLSREWIKGLTTSVTAGLERRDQYLRDTVTVPMPTIQTAPHAYEPRTILVTTPSVCYDGRDSFIRPRKGVCAAVSLDVSKGLENSLDDFLKLRADMRYYWSPFSRLTFAGLGRAGYLEPYGDAEDVPSDQLFFLGGTSTVRGFHENLLRFDRRGKPVGGRRALSGSVEARIDLGKNFEFTGFYDIGNVSETAGVYDSDTFRPSAGVGLRYITPIGPVGLLYGFKLDREEGEESGRLHFSIGYTF